MRDAGDVTGRPIGPAVSRPPRQGDAGFSRARRIVHNTDYQRIFSGQHRRAGHYLVLWTMGNGPVDVPRVGVIASKRTFRRAVDRARAKRLLREAFRLNRERFARHCDCVLVARHAILQAGRGDVERDLVAVARRCGIWRRTEGGEST